MTTTHDDKSREREQFEQQVSEGKVAIGLPLSLEDIRRNRRGEEYLNNAITDAWMGWQARAALSPASGQEANECRLTLLVQVHELCDQIERTLHTFGTDEEGRKQAEGAVAYARKVSQPFNYNGPFRAAPAQQVEAEIRDRALEEAAKACYDPSNRGLTDDLWEDACEACAKAIRSMKSAAGSNNGEKG